MTRPSPLLPSQLLVLAPAAALAVNFWAFRQYPDRWGGPNIGGGLINLVAAPLAAAALVHLMQRRLPQDTQLPAPRVAAAVTLAVVAPFLMLAALDLTPAPPILTAVTAVAVPLLAARALLLPEGPLSGPRTPAGRAG